MKNVFRHLGKKRIHAKETSKERFVDEEGGQYGKRSRIAKKKNLRKEHNASNVFLTRRGTESK